MNGVTLELLDSDVTLESKNITFNNADVDEVSFNVTLPINLFNKEQTDFLLENSVTTSHNCLVNVGEQHLMGKLNVDKYNALNQTLECTLYPNKQIVDFLTTPINRLLIDQPVEAQINNWNTKLTPNPVAQDSVTLIPWGPFSYNRGWGITSSEFKNYIPAHWSNLIPDGGYATGANSHYGKDRTYLNSWYNPEFDDDDFIKYQTQGCGAYKNYMYHTELRASNIIGNLNEQYKKSYNVNFDVIKLQQTIDNVKIYCGSEKVSPYTRSQWCSWIVGEREGNNITYPAGRTTPIPIDRLGATVLTQDSDEYSVVFDRDCTIQFEKIHLWGQTTTLQVQSAHLRLVLLDQDNRTQIIADNKDYLFDMTAYDFVGVYSIVFNGLHNIEYQSLGVSFNAQPICEEVNQGIFKPRIIHIKKGWRLMFQLVTTNSNVNVKYLSLQLKWNYVYNNSNLPGYQLTDDDFDVDMEYWSGMGTELQNIDKLSDYFKTTQLATRRALRKVFDKTLTEILIDSHQYGKWSEPFVVNYYGLMMNLGELTPLQLCVYIATVYNLDVYVDKSGCLVCTQIGDKLFNIQDAQLLSIDYLNDKFGYYNHIKYGDDSQLLVGTSENPNAESNKVIFETDNVTDRNYTLVPRQMPDTNVIVYQQVDFFTNCEQEGSNDENGDIKFNDVGNWFNSNKTYLFDELFKINIPKYTYHFKIPSIIPPQNIVNINKQRYMILSRKIVVNEQTTEIEAIKF